MDSSKLKRMQMPRAQAEGVQWSARKSSHEIPITAQHRAKKASQDHAVPLGLMAAGMAQEGLGAAQLASIGLSCVIAAACVCA
jgi:hypothetical protein